MCLAWQTHRPRALILFAGPGERADRLAAFLAAVGFDTTEVDIKIGGSAHDVARPDVRELILVLARAGRFDLVIAAPPCQSFSVLHRPRLRTSAHPEGLPLVPPEWARYVRKHNLIAAFAFEVVAAVVSAGGEALVENPAARSGPPVGVAAAAWARFSDHGSLWHTAAAQAMMHPGPGSAEAALTAFTLAQCAYDAPHQKWTTLAVSAGLREAATGVAERTCAHGMGRHASTLIGREADGSSRATSAAAYPRGVNALIAALCAVGFAAKRGKPTRSPPSITGAGLIASGAGMCAAHVAAIELARHAPLRFASSRAVVDAVADELALEPFSGTLLSRPMLNRPTPAHSLKRGRELPTENSARVHITIGETGDVVCAQPRGAIAIADLYLPGVYEACVAPWLRAVDSALRVLASGGVPPKIETVVLPQEAMPAWARGVIWDCADPADCKPARRSTRHTTFPGTRQLDRAAVRAMAEEIEWGSVDSDIIDQIGGGGVEARTECPLTTVLAWHHKGVMQHAQAVGNVIAAELKDEWVAPPVAHLPFVPIRCLPRNVVMQQRARVREGVVEYYDKPRITQDSSDGAEASVNAGVSGTERSVELPTVQHLARAAAIIEGAGDESTHAQMYCVDATSAFRFCPLQHLDLWTQAFCWWALAADGSITTGVCVDRRMAFGGTYSPNRFQRISRFIGACAGRLHRMLDEAQPPPVAARQWQARRTRACANGDSRLAGDDHVVPRYLQVFIDDWGGVALDDEVTPPAYVAGIVISAESTLAAGGTFVGQGTRVHVHAQITIFTLTRAGLEAAGNKTEVGDPVISLGLRVARARWRVDIPEGKRLIMLAELGKLRDAAGSEPPTVDVTMAQRVVGRLGNLSQVMPEILAHIHGGHAIVNGVWAQRAAGRPGGQLRLRRNSPAHADWIELLERAAVLVDANAGVSLAPRAIFPRRLASGSVTVITDASGNDGVGGYGFAADHPGHVWIMSERWPADIMSALTRAAMTPAERAAVPAGGILPMPAAELFGMMALPRAMASAGVRVAHVFSVGDCEPAMYTVQGGRSKHPVMRALLQSSLGLTPEWLAVAVPREQNTDADRLSHPSQLASVLEAAERALGAQHVHLVSASDALWEALRGAIAAGQVDALT